jgi:hypothetical protein
MSRKDEKTVAELLARRIPFPFDRPSLFLEGFGRVDRSARVGPNAFIAIEVETSQLHACTNVLKFWPLLESKPGLRLYLLHAFVHGGRAATSNRRKLATFAAKTMESTLGERFRYAQFEVDATVRRTKPGCPSGPELEKWCAAAV